MDFESHKSNISSLISSGHVDEAVSAVKDAFEEHGEAHTSLVYASHYMPKLATHYRELGDWKHDYPRFEDALLNPREGKSYPGTPKALYLLGSIKVFLQQENEAIPLLEKLSALETEHWSLPLAPAGSWGAALVECYRRVGDQQAANSTLSRYMELERKTDKAELRRRQRAEVRR